MPWHDALHHLARHDCEHRFRMERNRRGRDQNRAARRGVHGEWGVQWSGLTVLLARTNLALRASDRLVLDSVTAA